MSKIAFIYPGQGAQKCGMGADFYENSASVRKLFDEAGEQLGLDMKALCFEENDLLDQTEYTQAAMVTTCLAMTEVLMERGVKPDITAGLSLGEYAAISVAGRAGADRCDPPCEKTWNFDAAYSSGRRRRYVRDSWIRCRENRSSDSRD